MISTDTTLDQDRKTEGNCVCVYTVQCRVMVGNKNEFQHSSHDDCNFDARLVTKKAEGPTIIPEIRLDDLRSPTHAKQKRNTRSHLAKCDSLGTLQVGQLSRVLPIQCVKAAG